MALNELLATKSLSPHQVLDVEQIWGKFSGVVKRAIRPLSGSLLETDRLIAKTKAFEARWKGEQHGKSKEEAISLFSDHNLETYSYDNRKLLEE